MRATTLPLVFVVSALAAGLACGQDAPDSRAAASRVAESRVAESRAGEPRAGESPSAPILVPGAAPATTRPADAPVLDAIAARVNRKTITASMVEKKIGENRTARGPAEHDKAYTQATITLVREALEQEKVEQVGLALPPNFIKEEIERQKESKGAAEFASSLQERAISEKEYGDNLAAEYSRTVLLQAQRGGFAKKETQFRPEFWPEPTAAELRSYYRAHLSSPEITQTNRAHVQTIVLPFSFYGETGRPAEHAREVAGVIREALKTGADFGTLARKYSHDPTQSKDNHDGDLGWVSFEGSTLAAPVLDFAFKGPLNELSPIIPLPNDQNPRFFTLVLVRERAARRVVSFAEAQPLIYRGLREAHMVAAENIIERRLYEEAYIWPPEIKRDVLRMLH